jgi:hypothetical protein
MSFQLGLVPEAFSRSPRLAIAGVRLHQRRSRLGVVQILVNGRPRLPALVSYPAASESRGLHELSGPKLIDNQRSYAYFMGLKINFCDFRCTAFLVVRSPT